MSQATAPTDRADGTASGTFSIGQSPACAGQVSLATSHGVDAGRTVCNSSPVDRHILTRSAAGPALVVSDLRSRRPRILKRREAVTMEDLRAIPWRRELTGAAVPRMSLAELRSAIRTKPQVDLGRLVDACVRVNGQLADLARPRAVARSKAPGELVSAFARLCPALTAMHGLLVLACLRGAELDHLASCVRFAMQDAMAASAVLHLDVDMLLSSIGVAAPPSR